VKPKLAIIGTGIAGMSAAYFLKDDYDITVYEKNGYIGGHTNTVVVDEEGTDIPIDTGFMVFNEVTYPYFCKLIDKLKVPYKDTDMSFAVRHNQSGLEYNGSSLNGLFAQRANLLKPSYWKFLLDINKFFDESPKILDQEKYASVSIRDYVNELGLGQNFYDKFLVPMSSAVWSTPTDRMGDFPAQSLVRFFYNHGFMGLNTQHQWKTIIGGSQNYRKILIESFIDRIRINDAAVEVEQLADKVKVTSKDSGTEEFDKVVFAGHADEMLAIIKNPTTEQQRLLEPFKYQENIAVLHQDASAMPKLKKVWSSWNYVIPNEKETYTVYYMNMLQGVSKKYDYFININGEKYVDPDKVLRRIVYHHPTFDTAAIAAQKELQTLNTDDDRLYFCGSYFRYGFHEDALMSSVILCNTMLKREVL
jgi:predicted NAD/FAD-binding protein